MKEMTDAWVVYMMILLRRIDVDINVRCEMCYCRAINYRNVYSAGKVISVVVHPKN